jgi:hypothetical protein
MRFGSLVLLAALAAIGFTAEAPPTKPERQGAKPTRFLPPVLSDEWTKWIVGEWEGSGEGSAGKGKGTVTIELALSGQFLIHRGRAEITALDPDYLKKHMHASDEEIKRFKRTGYQGMEVYTIDQKTGEVVGFLFDNLRCIATGRGKREGWNETVEWDWGNGQKSTRVTERASEDRMVVIERTPNPDGSVMEDKGDMKRIKRQSVSTKQ